jgi:hypothetical protein
VAAGVVHQLDPIFPAENVSVTMFLAVPAGSCAVPVLGAVPRDDEAAVLRP